MSMPVALPTAWENILTSEGGERDGQGTMSGKRAMLVVTIGVWESHYSPRVINGPIDDLLFPIQHGVLHYPGFDVQPTFVVYRSSRTDDDLFAAVQSALEQPLDTLATTAPIPFRKAKPGGLHDTGADLARRYCAGVERVCRAPGCGVATGAVRRPFLILKRMGATGGLALRPCVLKSLRTSVLVLVGATQRLQHFQAQPANQTKQGQRHRLRRGGFAADHAVRQIGNSTDAAVWLGHGEPSISTGAWGVSRPAARARPRGRLEVRAVAGMVLTCLQRDDLLGDEAPGALLQFGDFW